MLNFLRLCYALSKFYVYLQEICLSFFLQDNLQDVVYLTEMFSSELQSID